MTRWELACGTCGMFDSLRWRCAERCREDGDMARRSYGTGALYVRRDARGRATWYGKWRVGGRQVKRRIGAVRQTGTREGLTRAQAERELRRKIESTVPAVSAGERRTVEEAGEQWSPT